VGRHGAGTDVQRAVQLERLRPDPLLLAGAAEGFVVQTVDVLRDEPGGDGSVLEGSESVMRSVGLSISNGGVPEVTSEPISLPW
jgi:hypothetical protein